MIFVGRYYEYSCLRSSCCTCPSPVANSYGSRMPWPASNDDVMSTRKDHGIRRRTRTHYAIFYPRAMSQPSASGSSGMMSLSLHGLPPALREVVCYKAVFAYIPFLLSYPNYSRGRSASYQVMQSAFSQSRITIEYSPNWLMKIPRPWSILEQSVSPYRVTLEKHHKTVSFPRARSATDQRNHLILDGSDCRSLGLGSMQARSRPIPISVVQNTCWTLC